MPNATMAVRNPGVPYLVGLNGPLLGRRITIEGCVNPSAVRFVIYFKVGGDANADVAFVFNPRFTSQYTNPLHVIRNTKVNGVWGTEERRHSGQFPFKQGREYKVEIACEQDRFMMYVDGKFFDYYNHRLPLSSITHLEITEDTKVSLVQISEDNKDSAEVEKFCRMLAEKLKRVPAQDAAKAQSAIMMKLLELETSTPAP